MAWVMRRLGKGRRAGFGLARAGTGCSFHFCPLKPVLACISRSRPAEAPFPSTLKPEELARNALLG
jgi:hypothetical protein